MSALPEHRRIVHGRTHSRSWNPCDADPIQGYRGGGGTGWRLFVALLRGAACLGGLAAIGALLAWRG